MKKLSAYVIESLVEVNESINNFFEGDKAKKEKYKDQVYSILELAYKNQGGLIGSGFKNPDDMVNNIPFWKLDIVNGEVLAVVMYKFSENASGVKLRKRVAMGKLFDRGRKDLISKKMINIAKEDLKRSISEVSGKSEEFNKKLLGSAWNDYLIPVDKVKEILNKDGIIPIDKYRYKRKIGGELKEKIMIGTPVAKR